MNGEDNHMNSREEYNAVVSKSFGSEEEGYRFYNDYANVKWFSVERKVASHML
jgi:hypothetical protein